MICLALSESGTAQATQMEVEARKVAQEFWRRALTKCGDSYYYRDPRRLVQYKEVSFEVSPRALSRADRLNGFQWQGLTVMMPALFRERNRETTGEHAIHPVEGPWSGWQDGENKIRVRQQVSNQVKSEYLIFEEARLGRDQDPSNLVAMTKSSGQWSFYAKWGGDSNHPEQIVGPACGSIEGMPEFVKQLEAERKTHTDGYWNDSKTHLMWAAAVASHSVASPVSELPLLTS
jgi:hypothetical protein